MIRLSGRFLAEGDFMEFLPHYIKNSGDYPLAVAPRFQYRFGLGLPGPGDHPS